MKKYYTRACNFFYGATSRNNLKKKTSLPLNGSKDISFDTIEIISREKVKKIKLVDINNLTIDLKKKVIKDLKNITKIKKFKYLNFKKHPLIMGILNITPDSFSDGGKYNNSKKSFNHAKNMIKLGCDILDIGAESTRPGSVTIDNTIEWKRLKGPLNKISKLNKVISLDTRKEYVMKKSLKYKINIINDISGLDYDSNTLKFLKRSNVPFILNHIQGEPSYMQKNPKYKNVLLDIYDFFEKKIKQLRANGIFHNNIIIDPGIGFGKNLKHNITLMKNVSIFHSLGFPLLLGVSKKKFIKDISGINDSKNRSGGTIASSIYLIMQGVQILRIHDVNEISQAVKVYKSLSFK